jgi:hypothetical protein
VAWKFLSKDPNFSSGYFSLMQIEGALADGDLQLWLVVDDDEGEVLAAMLTEVQAGDDMQVVNAVSMAGERLQEYLGMISDGVGTWARLKGYDELRVEGRLGWEPVLKDWGFRKQAVVMSRRLQEVH